MIDTIRFRIPITDSIYKSMAKRCVETRRFDYNINEEIFRFSRQDISVGSWDRKISVYVPDDEEIYLEMSVPKFLLGHNVWLISYADFYNAISKVRILMNRYFKTTLVDVTNWEIMRLDLCYAWKLDDQARAESVLNILQNFNFSRKKKSTYDSSVMYIGHTYSLKFYLKYPEFLKHDFKYLRDNNFTDFAYNMLNNARGVLRFEVTLRSQYLHYHFKKKHVFMTDLKEDKLFDMMVILFNKYMGGFNIKYCTKKQIKKQLQDYWGETKGGRLFIFYLALISEGRQNLKDIYSYSRLQQFIHDIQEAEVPLVYENVVLKDDFDLSIPSSNVTNNIKSISPPREGGDKKAFDIVTLNNTPADRRMMGGGEI